MNIELEQNNKIENNLDVVNNQNNFLDSMLWKTIDNGIDIGIRYILPDFIEDQIINLKDNLINYGLKEGISRSIKSAIDIGKSAIGIATGNFEDVSQIQTAIKKGGIIDSISNVLDSAVNKAANKGKIDKNVAKLITNGKNSILSNVEKNIESTLTKQLTSAQNLETYMNNWKEYYNKKDFNNMDSEYKLIQKQMKELIPIENTIKSARKIETIHNIIKNNGKNFDLSVDELELVDKLNL